MDDKIKTILKANHLYDKDNKKLKDFNITHNKLDELFQILVPFEKWNRQLDMTK